MGCGVAVMAGDWNLAKTPTLMTMIISLFVHTHLMVAVTAEPTRLTCPETNRVRCLIKECVRLPRILQPSPSGKDKCYIIIGRKHAYFIVWSVIHDMPRL